MRKKLGVWHLRTINKTGGGGVGSKSSAICTFGNGSERRKRLKMKTMRRSRRKSGPVGVPERFSYTGLISETRARTSDGGHPGGAHPDHRRQKGRWKQT